MPTVTQKLRDQIDLLETAAISSREQFQRVVKERDAAISQISILMNSEKAALSGAAAVEARYKGHIRKLFSIIYRQSLDSEHKAGWMARVREKENATQSASAPYEDDNIARLDLSLERERLAGATGDRAVGRIIDSMDTETLDAVLGRGADGFQPD